ncbi:MAG: hypothetical protein ACR2RV_24415 [Verrucomicrobiales bacterium]
MRSFRLLSYAIVVVFTLAGCSKSPEDKAASQMVEILDELGDAISSVNDETSASKAATKISEIANRFNELVEQTRGFERDPSEKMQEEVEEAQARLREQLSNTGAKFAGNPQLMAKIMPAIIELASSVWKK